MNVALWRERFIAHLQFRDYAKATAYSYGLEVSRFLDFLRGRGLNEPAEIRREDVVSYCLQVQHARKVDGEPLMASSRRGKVGAVLAFLRYLYEEKLILANPGADIRRPKALDLLPPELPDEEQVLKLLETPDTSTPHGLRDRAILEVLYGSAIRNAELRSLNLADLDLHRLALRINLGKGRKGRLVPLSEPAAIWTEAYLQKARAVLVRDTADNGALFVNTWGRRLSNEMLGKIVRDLGKTARLPMRVTPHILRHACATHMLARKAGIRHLQHLLGHACPSSTQRYTRVEITDLREVFLRCHPRESC